jgi:hypothetical protein
MYCSQTEAAVRAFQQRYRLGVTGCVDLATWQRLFPCCCLSLRLSPIVKGPAAGVGQNRAQLSGQTGGQPSRQTGGQPSGQTAAQRANTPPPPAPKGDDDKKHELALGLSSDETLSLEYTYTMSQRELGSWLLSKDGVNLKQGLTGEAHQPYNTSLGRYLNFKYSLTAEDVLNFGGGKLSLDGFAEAAVKVPLDSGPKNGNTASSTPSSQGNSSGSTNDNTAGVAVHLGVDINIGLPKITGVDWLPKLVLEGTGGPETSLKSTNPKSWETDWNWGGELKASWEF